MAGGSVYQRGSDRLWVAKWKDHRGVWRYSYHRTRGAARDALRDRLNERDRGVTGENPTLREWTDWWHGQLTHRPTTMADYRYKLDLLPDWLMARRLREVTPMLVHDALAEIAAAPTARGKPRASSTVAAVRGVLRKALRTAERWGHVTRNAAGLVDPPTVTYDEVVPLTVDEATRLLEQVGDHRLGSLYTVAIACGLRQGECIGLTWEQVDLDAATIVIDRQITTTNRHEQVEGDPKTPRSVRIIRLPKFAADALRLHHAAQLREQLELAEVWEDRDLVWPSEVGTPLSPSNLRRHLAKACEDAGVRRVTFHTLRHSAASMLLAQGVPEAVIMDVLGQVDLRMIRRYQHVNDSLRSEAAAAMDQAFGGLGGVDGGVVGEG